MSPRRRGQGVWQSLLPLNVLLQVLFSALLARSQALAGLEPAGRFVADQWPCPEADGENEAQGQEHHVHRGTQADMVTQLAYQQRYYGATQDAGAQDAGKGTLMAGHGIECQRK